MVKLICALILFSFSTAYAGTVEGFISKIDYGKSSDEEHLLFINDGSVIRLTGIERKDLNIYEQLSKNRSWIKFKIDHQRRIKSSKILQKSTPSYRTTAFAETYEPTVLSSSEESQKIFKNLRRGERSSSQCYNRAHVWTYESKNSFDLNAMKVFIFFTRKYIRQFNYKWWFHVAPFTYVADSGSAEERVLDPKFTKGPLPMKTWTDIFMINKAACPAVSKYSDYENNQDSESCYLYKASMYYVQPLDLDNLERTGQAKNKFIEYEVNRAYRNGFGWWY